MRQPCRLDHKKFLSSSRFFIVHLSSEQDTEVMEKTKWSETVILADADYADAVAFDLIVNFERMLGRRIPKADLPHWLVCVALDGGVPTGQNEIQVIFVHDKEKKTMDNFIPSDFGKELDGKAFRDEALGEFTVSSVRAENLVSKEDFFIQSLEALADEKSIKRLIVVPDMEQYGLRVKSVLGRTEGKDITLLAMEPQTGRNFKNDILGYSLMSALGIHSEELK